MMAAKPSNQFFNLINSILLFCLVLCSSSSARPLLIHDHYFYPRSLVASVKIGRPSPSAAMADLKGCANWPCQDGDEMGSDKKNLKMMMVNPAIQGKLGGRFGALVMNVLPKGNTPPSGPSRRNNGINT